MTVKSEGPVQILGFREPSVPELTAAVSYLRNTFFFLLTQKNVHCVCSQEGDSLCAPRSQLPSVRPGASPANTQNPKQENNLEKRPGCDCGQIYGSFHGRASLHSGLLLAGRVLLVSDPLFNTQRIPRT